MKLNIRTDSKASDTKERCREWTAVDQPDRAVSREELCRLLPGGAPSAATGTKAVSLSWLDKFTALISAWLWKRTVVGYQDETGFHYGTPPAHKESHAIGD
jgi:hypothetical protein